LRHPIYDCFYLALAQREGASLVTADNKMLGAAKQARVKVRGL
jgi:predicted nucleic acid-binding protein